MEAPLSSFFDFERGKKYEYKELSLVKRSRTTKEEEDWQETEFEDQEEAEFYALDKDEQIEFGIVGKTPSIDASSTPSSPSTATRYIKLFCTSQTNHISQFYCIKLYIYML